MNIQDLGSIGELVAAVATVATLVYLAIQIKHNSKASQGATEESVSTGFNDVNMLIAGNSELSRLFMDGIENPLSLTEDQQIQFSFLLRCYMNHYYRLFMLYKGGTLDKKRWLIYAQEVAMWTSTPGGEAWKKANPGMVDLWSAVEGVKIENVESIRLEFGSPNTNHSP